MEEMKTELSEQAKAARREYQRKWRAKNKDKIKAQNKRYWERQGKELSSESEAANEQAENS